MEFKEQIQRILENVPKVYEAGRSSIKNEVSNALKGSASGEAVALKDVSPLEHNLGVMVKSKNLFDVSKVKTNVYANIVNNGDGTITVKNKGGRPCGSTFGEMCPDLKVGDVFTLSLRVTNAVEDTKQDAFIYLVGLERSVYTGTSLTTTQDMLNSNVYLYTSTATNQDNVTEGVVSEIQVELDTKATPYTPYIADTSGVKLKVQGGNILDFDLCVGGGLEKIGDNTYRLSWKINQWGDETRFSERVPFVVPTNTKLVFSYELVEKSLHHNADDNIEMYVRLLDKSYGEAGAANVINGVGAFEVTQEPAIFDICLLSSGQFGDYVIFKNPQLKIGTTATEYEPYKEPIEYAYGDEIKSIYPSTTLMTDTEGAVVEVEYNRDLNKAFEELMNLILSLGGNVYD